MTSDDIDIRPAHPDEAMDIARAIDMAGGGVYQFLLGGLVPGLSAVRLLAPGIAGTTGTFSHRQCAVAARDETVVGVAHAYPVDWIRGADRGFIPADRIAHLAAFDDMQDWGSYFLSALSVAPDLRRRGIAGRLLDWVFERARAGGFDRVTLHVWADNAPARQFYAKHGFEDVGVAAIARHSRLDHEGGSVLMRRYLS